MLVIFFIILWICIAGWVYDDACERKSSCAILWCILTAIFGIFILPIYFLCRSDKPEKKEHYRVTHSVALCPNCGKYYQKPVKFCPNCGAEINK